jgi:hypothetical protein
MKKLHFGLGQMYLHFWFTNLVLQIGQKSHQFSSSAIFAVNDWVFCSKRASGERHGATSFL